MFILYSVTSSVACIARCNKRCQIKLRDWFELPLYFFFNSKQKITEKHTKIKGTFSYSGLIIMVLGVGGLANQMALLRSPHGSVIGQRRAI